MKLKLSMWLHRRIITKDSFANHDLICFAFTRLDIWMNSISKMINALWFFFQNKKKTQKTDSSLRCESSACIKQLFVLFPFLIYIYFDFLKSVTVNDWLHIWVKAMRYEVKFILLTLISNVFTKQMPGICLNDSQGLVNYFLL